MKLRNTRTLLALFVACLTLGTTAQVNDPYPWVNKEKFPHYKPSFNPDPFLAQPVSKGKRVPAVKATEQPLYVNNAETPYFPPIFMQDEGSCTSAARIGYMFTYEMNAYRAAQGSLTRNQYPTHYTWLLYYNTTLERLAAGTGIPNRDTYGGRTYSYLFGSQTWYSNQAGWMQGYDRWYEAMHNRISGSGQFPENVRTESGREAVKNWLWNHNGDTAFAAGGVCCMDVAAIGLTQGKLPSTTANREAGASGKYYIKSWGTALDHSLTIVGYDDRLEFDLDGNGVSGETSKDEKGAWILANSWGDTWGNNGFIYCPYKYAVVIGTQGNGSDPDDVYTGYYHPEVFYVKQNFKPLRTLKIKIQFTKRSELALVGGVSQDTASASPAKFVGFEHFTNAGNGFSGTFIPDAETPMLGHWADGMHSEPMEFGYDLTDLTVGLDRSKPTKYFFEIYPKSGGTGTGKLLSCSIIDYEYYPQGVEIPFDIPEGGIDISSASSLISVSRVMPGENIYPPHNATLVDSVLQWQAPALSASAVNRYRIYCDGTQLKEVEAGTLSTKVESPDLNYQISALYDFGSNCLESSKTDNVSQRLEKTGGDNLVRLFNHSGFHADDLLTSTLGSATLEYWIKPTSLADYSQLVSPETGNFFAFVTASGQLSSGWNMSNRFTSAAGIIKAGEWNHIAITVNGSTLTGYVNGEQAGSITSTTFNGFGGFTRFKIGEGTQIAGALDEVRVWSEARTQAQIKSDMGCEIAYPVNMKNLLAYYRMDTVVVNGTVKMRDCAGKHHGDFNNPFHSAAVENFFETGTLQAGFTVAAGPYYVGSPVQFTNASSPNTVRWQWNAPGAGVSGLAAASPDLIFTQAGPQAVTLTVYDGNGNHADTTVTLNLNAIPQPVAAFTATATHVAAGDAVSFHNLSTGSLCSYQWSMPGADSERAATSNALAIYSHAGTYTVTLKAVNAAGESTVSQDIVVEEVAPQVNFTVNPPIVTKGESVQLTDKSRYSPQSWSWSVENDHHAFVVNGGDTLLYPSHPGIYNVTLTASNAQGTRHLTRTGALTVCNAASLRGLTFSGAGERVTTTGILADSAKQFTIEWWMYATGLRDKCDAMGESDATFRMRANNDGTLFVCMSGSSVRSGTDFVQTLGWHHYAVTYNAGAITFYRDGIKHSANTSAVRACPRIESFSIGADDAPMVGMIDELRIWNSALPLATLNTLNNRPIDNVADAEKEGLQLYYNFNQDGGDVKDATGAGYTGVRSGFGPDGDAWSSSLGVFCLNFDNPVQSDITSQYLTNYKAPFVHTSSYVNGTARFYALETGTAASGWVVKGAVNPNGIITGLYVDSQKSYAMTVETKWDNFATDLKDNRAWQLLTLPAGFYTLTVTAQNEFESDNSYLAVAAGDTLPVTEQLSTLAIAYSSLSTKQLKFSLSAESRVSLGLIVNMSGKRCLTIGSFKLTMQDAEELTNVKPLILPAESNIELYPVKGGVVLKALHSGEVKVYTLEGRNLFDRTIEGRYTLSLPSGLYIVNGQKVMIR